MKAKLINGEIVEVDSYTRNAFGTVTNIRVLRGGNFEWIYGEGNFEILPDEPETLTSSFDWESFRNENAAKLFLFYESIQPYNEFNIGDAINKVDELIKQLKATKP